jgi:uncharacterized protein
MQRQISNIEAADEDRRTSLSWAAENGHTEIVQILLNANANIEAASSFWGQTALSLAAENGHTEVVQLLLNAKANIEAADKDRRTSLSWAAENGHAEIVKLLTSDAEEVKQTGEYLM